MDNLMHKINAYVGRTIDFRTGTEVETLDDKIVNWNIAEKPEPTEEQLNAFEDEARILESDNQIIKSRKAEYDQLNQFEMQFDDNRDGTTTWVDAINEIKGRHPK